MNFIDTAHLRIARPTDNLLEIIRFYCGGLGFEVINSFEDHDGFDGVMLGRRGLPYHLEFTHRREYKVGRAPTKDNLLNWDVTGKTFEDADGYRVVLQQATWQ